MEKGIIQRDTTIATFHRIAPDHLEAIYKPGCVLGRSELREVGHTRRELMGGARYAMLSILPEDCDFTMQALADDHLASDREESKLWAMAVVARASLMETIVKLHFGHFPWHERMLITQNEQEARTWIDAQLKALRTPTES